MKNFEVGSWSSFLFRASAPLLIKQLLVSACCLEEGRTTRGLTISIILWNRGRDEDRR